MLCSQSIGVPRRGGSHSPHVPFTRWACRDKSRAGGICRPESRLGARRRPGEGRFRTRLLLVPSGLGAGSCPAGASRLPPGPSLSFADRLARKLSVCLVLFRGGERGLRKSPSGGACGAATGGRSRPSGPALLALSFGAAGWGAPRSRARPPRAGQLAFFRFLLRPPAPPPCPHQRAPPLRKQ